MNAGGRSTEAFDSFTKFLRSSRKTILLTIIAVAITLIISLLISIWLSQVTDLGVPSFGTIKTLGVEVYWDENLENETREVYWGTIYPGDSTDVGPLYIRSISNLETTLHLNTSNWMFLDSDNNIVAQPDSYMNLTWDHDEAPVQPDEIVQVTLTLSASSSSDFIYYLVANDVTNFSFDIVIYTSAYSD